MIAIGRRGATWRRLQRNAFTLHVSTLNACINLRRSMPDPRVHSYTELSVVETGPACRGNCTPPFQSALCQIITLFLRRWDRLWYKSRHRNAFSLGLVLFAALEDGEGGNLPVALLKSNSFMSKHCDFSHGNCPDLLKSHRLAFPRGNGMSSFRP